MPHFGVPPPQRIGDNMSEKDESGSGGAIGCFILILAILGGSIAISIATDDGPETKVIIDKGHEEEFTLGGGTVWFVVAEDGTTCNVSRGFWYQLKKGDSVKSDYWE